MKITHDMVQAAARAYADYEIENKPHPNASFKACLQFLSNAMEAALVAALAAHQDGWMCTNGHVFRHRKTHGCPACGAGEMPPQGARDDAAMCKHCGADNLTGFTGDYCGACVGYGLTYPHSATPPADARAGYVMVPRWKLERDAEALESRGEDCGVARDLRDMLATPSDAPTAGGEGREDEPRPMCEFTQIPHKVDGYMWHEYECGKCHRRVSWHDSDGSKPTRYCVALNGVAPIGWISDVLLESFRNGAPGPVLQRECSRHFDVPVYATPPASDAPATAPVGVECSASEDGKHHEHYAENGGTGWCEWCSEQMPRAGDAAPVGVEGKK